MNQEQKQQTKPSPQPAFTRSIIGLAAIVALVLGTWFGIKRVEQRQQAQSLQAAKEVAEKSNVNQQENKKSVGDDVAFLLDMQLKDLHGNSKVVANQLAKVTLVNFWATWCAPCREEMPIFNSVHQTYKDQGFGVLGLAIDNAEGTAAFVQQLGIAYPVLMAEDEGWDLLNMTGNPKNLMPYSFLIDQDGKLLEIKLGPLHEEELVSWVVKYL